MGRKLILALLPLCLAAPLAVAASIPDKIIPDCNVLSVTGGDSLTALCAGQEIKVSLYGIDAPEVAKRSPRTGKALRPGQPFGEEARLVLEQKVGGNHLSLEVMAVDRFKRRICLVKVGEHLINREMIAEGWAWAYRPYHRGPHNLDFIVAEKAARAARKGLWQQKNPQSPWAFRKENW